jgi:vacuolar-type H+-ATPase subunit I/STV1
VEKLFELLDPFRHFGERAYESFFIWLFTSIFKGWLARFLGFVFLFLAYWYWVRREQMARGIGFLILAIIMGYGWFLFKIIGLVK